MSILLLLFFISSSILTRFATGLEFREPSLVISPKCSLSAKEGCAMHLSCSGDNDNRL